MTTPTLEMQPLTVPAPEPQRLRLWHHRWSAKPVPLRGPEHLAVLLSSLRPESDHAGITDETNERWAQVKRIDSHWWVEGWRPPEEWPGVFVPDSWLDEGSPRRSLDDHACWSHPMAAELVWAWLDGRTVDGAVRLPAPGGGDD